MRVNEYGAALDRNGYAPSLLQDGLCSCYLCGGATEKVDRHEVFGGAYREKSKRLGLWVMLCHNSCHIFGQYAVHNNAEIARSLKETAQQVAMVAYGWDTQKFIQEFGRNYLDA